MTARKNARLKSFCMVGAGGTPSRDSLERYYQGGTIPWVKSGELREKIIFDTEEQITEEALRETNVKIVPAGALLLAMYGATVGRLGILGVPATTNQAVCHIIPDPMAADVRYLFHVLSNQVSALVARGVGGAQPNISQGIVKDLSVALPPLPEQRRIATILDKADELRAKRRAAISKLDSLTQAIFLDMFGDPVRNDRGWPITPVGHFVAGFETGKSLMANDEDDGSTGLRVLKVSAVTSLRFRPEESKALPPDYVPPPSHFVRKGDLLFSRANTQELIGATALVEDAPEGLVLPDKLWRFTWHGEPRADPHFVHWLFRQPRFRFELGRRATGTSGSMKNISQEKVLDIKVTLPGLSLQRKFGRIAYAINRLRQVGEEALSTTDTAFASLQHRAFRGEL